MTGDHGYGICKRTSGGLCEPIGVILPIMISKSRLIDGETLPASTAVQEANSTNHWNRRLCERRERRAKEIPEVKSNSMSKIRNIDTILRDRV